MRDVVLTPSNGAPGSAFTFTLDDTADDTLEFSSDDPADETTWNLQYRAYLPQAKDLTLETLDFTTSFRMSSCDKIWNFPSDLTIFDTIYVNGDSTLTLEFQGVDLNNCEFEIEVGELDSVGALTPFEVP